MEKTIYERAIEKFGVEKQMDILIEEMAELTQALLKNRRKPNDTEIWGNVHEEFADVEIMLAQLKTKLAKPLIDGWKERKLYRLETLINKA